MKTLKTNLKVNDNLEIAGEIVPAGTMQRLELSVARLVTGSWLSLPLVVLNGQYEGPSMCLSAAIHGDELNGMEIIRQVISQIDPKTLKGRIIAVPIVNVFGFLEQSRYMPDRRDLNRSFPGSAKGSLTSRLAHLFLDKVMSHCNYAIDLHTGSNHRINLPQIRANLDDPETLNCAEAFAAPIILDAKERDGSLRQAAVKRDITVLLYEAGESHRLNIEAIEVGVAGVLRVMVFLDMLTKQIPKGEKNILKAKTSTWVRAGNSGVFYSDIELGQWVEKGSLVGIVRDTFGETLSKSKATVSGMIIGQVTNPLVNRGDALVHLARAD